ncbi:unnamed protein product [Chrysoparadoxa australica]
MEMTLLSQGAEARVYVTSFCGKPAIVKERFVKKYRLPELDAKITPKRTAQEVRCISKCRAVGVPAPCVLMVDAAANRIFMEKIEGCTAKVWLQQNMLSQPEEAIRLAYSIGRVVSLIHNAGVAHGDLTTSNFMITPKTEAAESRVVAIDFGLGFQSPSHEEKAVDLYVLERAFASTHEASEHLVAEVMRAYKACAQKADAVLTRLSQVRLRGRKRDMTG